MDLKIGPTEAKNAQGIIMKSAVKALQARGLDALQIAYKLKLEDGHRRLYNLCVEQLKQIINKYCKNHGPEHSTLPAANRQAFAEALVAAGDVAVQQYLGAKMVY